MPVRVERITKHCITCGTAFEVLPGKKRSAKKYCSFECSVTIRRTLPECACVHCGKLFHPRFADRMRYCSTECKELYKHDKRQERALDELIKRDIARDNRWEEVFTCKQCNQPFMQEHTRRAALYCSEECSTEFQRLKALEELKAIKESKPNTCKVCGKEFVSEYGSKLRATCSDECRTIHYKNIQHISRHKREERLIHAYVADVHVHKIFKRDNHMCMLCNQPLNMNVVVPHPLAPTIDHIKPIAKGGTHEPDNVQAAHFICNSYKSHNKFDVMKVAKYVWSKEICAMVHIKPFDYTNYDLKHSKYKRVKIKHSAQSIQRIIKKKYDLLARDYKTEQPLNEHI